MWGRTWWPGPRAGSELTAKTVVRPLSRFGTRHMRCYIRKPDGLWAPAKQTLHRAEAYQVPP